MPRGRERIERERRGDREERRTRQVEAKLRRPGLLRADPESEQRRDDAERQVDREHRPPAEVLREIAAEHWSGRARERKDGGEVSLVTPPLARWHELADQRLREGHQAAASEIGRAACRASV